MNKYLVYAALGIPLALLILSYPAHAQIGVKTALTVQASTSQPGGTPADTEAQAMVTSVATTDEKIADATVSSTSVSISYPVKARLFGIFPLSHLHHLLDLGVDAQYLAFL